MFFSKFFFKFGRTGPLNHRKINIPSIGIQSIHINQLISYYILLVIFKKMGQQCCSDEKVDQRIYQNSKINKNSSSNFNLQNSGLAVGYEGVDN